MAKRLINALMEERAPIVQLLSLLAAPLLTKMYTSIYRSVAAASRPTNVLAMVRRSYGERP